MIEYQVLDNSPFFECMAGALLRLGQDLSVLVLPSRDLLGVARYCRHLLLVPVWQQRLGGNAYYYRLTNCIGGIRCF